MNLRITFLLLSAAAGMAQAPDPFTGTWKLNVEKSKFTAPASAYRSGTRTYQPMAGGTHVVYQMVRADGTTVNGDYTAQCKDEKCTAATHASWVRKDARTVEGETFADGKRENRYVRTLSSDGKTMTITFFPARGSKQVVSVQVWERQ